MSILILAEHTNSALGEATLCAVTAAKEIDGSIDILVAGSECEKVADAAAKVPGVAKVLCANNPCYKHMLAENVAELVASIAEGYDYVLAPATTTGKNILPRVAALMDASMISDVIAIESEDTFKRPIYAGNAIATVQTSDTKKVLSVRTTAFDASDAEGGAAVVESLDKVSDSGTSAFEGEQLAQSDRPELTSAKIVVSGGRGLGSGENFDMLYNFADKIGAAVGASRAAVDAGYVPNDMQVGQTGKIVAPDLYIAVGISGAIQHLAGMKESKVIVAVNKDEDAPIFEIADYGLVGDLFEAIPQLEQALTA